MAFTLRFAADLCTSMRICILGMKVVARVTIRSVVRIRHALRN